MSASAGNRPDGPPIASFPRSWVWLPSFHTWGVGRPRRHIGELPIRGLPTACLTVFPGRLVICATAFERRLHGWERYEYAWPAVVVERWRPVGGCGVLFEIDGDLARCGVPFAGPRLRRALEAAGFAVVGTEHWGWERPQAVPARELGTYVEAVPPAVNAG